MSNSGNYTVTCEFCQKIMKFDSDENMCSKIEVVYSYCDDCDMVMCIECFKPNAENKLCEKCFENEY